MNDRKELRHHRLSSFLHKISRTNGTGELQIEIGDFVSEKDQKGIDLGKELVTHMDALMKPLVFPDELLFGLKILRGFGCNMERLFAEQVNLRFDAAQNGGKAAQIGLAFFVVLKNLLDVIAVVRHVVNLLCV